MKTKILFIFHEDTRTGAPNALLSFLNYLKSNYSEEFILDIFILRSIAGELKPELKEIARKIFIIKKDKSIKTKITNVLKPTTPFLLSLQAINQYDLVYGNTILTLKYLSKLKKNFKKLKTLLHVHEGKYLTSLFLNKNKATIQFKNIDYIFTVNKSSAENLIKNYEVDSSIISIISPTIEHIENFDSTNPLKEKYKDNELILVNFGQPSLTKGTDLIPQIGALLRNKNLNLKFKILVIGFINDNDFLKSLKLDVSKLHLDNYIEFIPHTKTPLNYLEIANICLITSREESFSLVGIQAAMLKKPIVCFKNAIGISEILNEDSTFQADYLNVEEYTEQILKTKKLPEVTKQKTILANQIYKNILSSEKSNLKHYLELKKLT